jgi:hypothetical protein
MRKSGQSCRTVCLKNEPHALERRGNVCQHTVCLTFESSTIPEWATVLYRRYKVRPYLLNSVRCCRCRKCGHMRTCCTYDIICLKRGTKDHGDTNCPRPVQCINCCGAHSPRSLDCPICLQETEINKNPHDRAPVIPRGSEEAFRLTA